MEQLRFKTGKCFETARNSTGKRLFSTLLTEHRQHKNISYCFCQNSKVLDKITLSNLHMKTTLT